MRQLRESLKLKYETGLSYRAIAAACAVGAGSVSTYVQRALEAGLSWPLPEALDDAALEALLFTHAPVAGAARANPRWADVHRELKRPGVTLQLLWLEYCEQHPHGYRYSQFCELNRRWRGKLAPSMRQVDRDTGELIAVELFVGVLGASSYTYAEAVASQKLHDWVGANTRMLEHLQGSPAILVPDNLKSAVTKACRYEPLVNRTYGDFAAHYDAVVIPTRSFKPKDKAKVESGVLVAQRWLLARLRDRVFFDLVALNEAIAELCDELNDRPMRRLGVSRRELFEQLDRPALKPLPGTRYEIARWKTVRVNIDYHVEVERNLYSVPYQLLGEKLEARYTTTLVELYRNDRRIASHVRRHGRGAVATEPAHMPAAHRAHAQWTPSRLIDWAARSGPATAGLVTELLARKRHPEQGYRACLGLMRVGKRFGAERLEAACERAVYMQSFTYQTVKNILSSGFDKMPISAPSSAPPTPIERQLGWPVSLTNLPASTMGCGHDAMGSQSMSTSLRA